MLRECHIVPAEDAPKRRRTNSDTYALPFAAFGLHGMGLANLFAVADLRYADVPPRITGSPGEGIGDDGDDSGAVGGLRPFDRLAEVGKAFDMPRQRAHGFRVLGEVDRERLLDPAVLDKVVEGGAALGVLQPVDHCI